MQRRASRYSNSKALTYRMRHTCPTCHNLNLTLLLSALHARRFSGIDCRADFQNGAQLVEQSDLKRSCFRESERVSEREYDRMLK